MTPVGEILVALMDGVRDGLSLPELLCRDARRHLPAAAVGIAVMNDSGEIGPATGSDDRAEALERLTVSLGEGPCLDAFRTGHLHLQPDLRATGSSRWPMYTPAALDLNVRAVFSYPLRIGGIRLGALNVYRDEAGHLDDTASTLALHYADAAVMVVLHLQSALESASHGISTPMLDIGFRADPAVHQATGMVSVQAGVGLAEALLLLRARAYVDEQSIEDVARAVVERRMFFK